MGGAPGRDDAVIQAPNCWLKLLESRAMFEWGAFLAAAPWLRLMGRGDRHPVLVLPGFTAGDRSTQPLRTAIASNGYWVHGWRLGANIGPTDRIIEGMHERLHELHERHGRKVSLVGWSLGGIYARELARQHEDKVRQVITLGSPFRMTRSDRSTASWLFDRMSIEFREDVMNWTVHEDQKPLLPVPSTAIYSRTDGIVRWHTCIDAESERHENIEVHGSHNGLGWNPAAITAVLDRLAQPEGQWQRFRAPLALRPLYPRPASWENAA
jgi:pimeloyl-ACP methyl ester carboxylesterase